LTVELKRKALDMQAEAQSDRDSHNCNFKGEQEAHGDENHQFALAHIVLPLSEKLSFLELELEMACTERQKLTNLLHCQDLLSASRVFMMKRLLLFALTTGILVFICNGIGFSTH